MYGEDYIYYDGVFSLIIDKEINTWTDWHIFPTSRPYITFPEQKRTSVEIPGTNGVIDTSTIFTRYPTFNNRTGSIEFGIANGYNGLGDGPSMKKYMEIAQYLNGYKHIVNLDNENAKVDDVAKDVSLLPYHYEGYLTVKEYKPGEPYSTLTMEYDFDPFRYGDFSITAFKSAWFSRMPLKPIIPEGKTEPSEYSVTFNQFELYCDGCPIVPLITIELEHPGTNLKPDETITIKYRNDYLGTSVTMGAMTGSYRYPEIILYKRHGEKIDEEKKMEVTVTCNKDKIVKNVTLDFVPGRL